MGTREQHPEPIIELHPDVTQPLGIEEGDWIYIETCRGVIRRRARLIKEIGVGG